MFFLFVFSTSSLGLASLMTTADSISVKAPLSTFLTYSRMPCVCFTNLFYCTFRWEGTEKLSARLLLAVRRWLGRSKETVVSTVFLPCLPPLLYQGLLKAPAGSSLWIGNCVGKHLHSLNNHSQSPVGICYPWLVLTCSD